jgi:hypothetical protein
VSLETVPMTREELRAAKRDAEQFAWNKHGTSGADALDVRVVAQEHDRTILRIRNRTPFMIYIYIHNVRVGWVQPYRTGLMRGLRVGYHRLYAHSRFGSVYWGPRRIWVPGNWNLYR